MAPSKLSHPKRNRLVYGRSAGRSRYGAADPFDSDDDAQSQSLMSTKTANEKQSLVKEAYPVKKVDNGSYLPKTTSAVVNRTEFDIPSSDDDEIGDFTRPRVTSPPKVAVKRKMVDDTVTRRNLAPWERSKVDTSREADQTSSRKAADASTSPGDQLQFELRRSLSRSMDRQTTEHPQASTKTQHQHVSQSTPITLTAPKNPTTATERLAAMKQGSKLSGPSAEAHPSAKASVQSKRPSAPNEPFETQRKRTKIGTGSGDGSADHNTSMPDCNVAAKADMSADVFDFPDSSDEQAAEHNKTTRKLIGQPLKRQPKPYGKESRYKTKPPSGKQVSAPARLADMVTIEAESPDAPTRSTSPARSSKSTPKSSISSPPPTSLSGSATNPMSSSTPRPAKPTYRSILDSTCVPSPSTLQMANLEVSESSRPSEKFGAGSKLTKSASDVPGRRVRMVDRLKAAAQNADDEDSDSNEEALDMRGNAPRSASPPPESLTHLQPEIASASQTQSQPKASQSNGPKITYASTRSFLPEDSLEDDLMLGLMTDIPRQPLPAPASKSRPKHITGKTEFDLDSDEEDEGKKFRTIHELRAAGRNARTMEDIETSLRDIENHNMSNASRRRSALIELATKLLDKTFAERFTGGNYELQLMRECTGTSDPVSDFILATVFTLVFANGISDHSVELLKEKSVVTWLARLLTNDREVARLARDRQSNLSKATQNSLLDLASMLKEQPSLWDNQRPRTITPRLVSLKALEQLIQKVRRSGDKSEILDPAHLPCVLPDSEETHSEAKQVETGIAISVLELLSTSSLSLNWPLEVIASIRKALPQLNASFPSQRHLLFLTLRLCLNLSNDNSRNCNELTSKSTVQYLLHSVKNGFNTVAASENMNSEDPDGHAVAFDLLVLSIGITTNLAEHSERARESALAEEGKLSALINIFQEGQKHMVDAESVEESISNVAFGYLAIMLANLCQSPATKRFIASKLSGNKLDTLVAAVEEFVAHHQKVDSMTLDGDEGTAVWGAFTEGLKAALARLKAAASDEG